MDFGGTAQAVDEIEWEEKVGNSTILREPIGVCRRDHALERPPAPDRGKVGPAIAAGCSIVAKPSEVTPLDAYVLAEIIDEIGLPPGVFNLVTGRRGRR